MTTEEKQSYINDLIGRWYESQPYGDQIPNALPRLLAEFCQRHGLLNEAGMLDAFCEATPDDPMLQLFECIFAVGAEYAIDHLSDAVYDREDSALKLIGLTVLGTLATLENDPNLECKHQHVMHPNLGGRMLFAEQKDPPSGEP